MTRPGRAPRSVRVPDLGKPRRVAETVAVLVGAVLVGGAAVGAAGVHPPSDDHTLTAGGSVGGRIAAGLTGARPAVPPAPAGAAALAAAPAAGQRRASARRGAGAGSGRAAAAGSGAPLIVVPRPDPPVRVRIDGVDIDQPVVPAGLTDRGALALPSHPDTVGWYRWGSWPDRPSGSVLLAAHLDSRMYGVGPFTRLRTTVVGSTVTIWSHSGLVTRYRVLVVREYLKTAVPYPQLTNPDGPRRLVLLTCGGPYLPDRGGYQDTVVVVAVAE